MAPHSAAGTTMRHFPENLGLATDLLLHEKSGTVEQRDDYVVVRTPDAPEYFFGNMLVLPRRPSASDLKRLEYDFGQFVGVPPLIAHRTFAWSESTDKIVNLEAFAERGYNATVCRVLATDLVDIRPVATNSLIKVRAFGAQADWDDWSQMQLSDMPDPTNITSQRYMAYQQKAYKSLIARDLGNWWGAFVDDEQVGSLGLFFLDGVGRFQSILTGQRHRNQNICKTLMSDVIRRTAGRSRQLVVVADESYHAGKIYEAMGFHLQGRIASLCQEPANTTAL